MTAESNLPVFKVTGGTVSERESFIQQLLTALEKNSLFGMYLKGDACQNCHLLLSQVKLCDLVLIDTEVGFPVQQILIGGQEKKRQDCFCWTGGDGQVIQRLVDRLKTRLDELLLEVPVWACILIGGRSSRMGRPKHLITVENQKTWLEKTVETISPLVQGYIVSGAGTLPDTLKDSIRLPDVPGVFGPLTGMLAASRWQPMVSWLFVACDMPYITIESIQWLLSGRHAGCWGRVPRLAESDHCEPLFAWYDFRSSQLFEKQLWDENLRIGLVGQHSKIDNPVIPDRLVAGWQNINTPAQLKAALK